MATTENYGLLTYKDESGNLYLLYPVTKAELVDGLDEALAARFTNEEKAKLAGIAKDANKYTLPVGGSAIGGVKNGGDIDIDASGNMTVGTGKVTRAKLANDSLYSPIYNTPNTAENIKVSAIGKTILPTAWGQDKTFTITQADSADFPDGAELAIIKWGTDGEVYLTSSDVKFCMSGESFLNTNKTFRISEPYGMIAIKKLLSNDEADMWLVTGNAEVVS